MEQTITVSATELQNVVANAVKAALAQKTGRVAIQKKAIASMPTMPTAMPVQSNIVDVATVTHAVPTRSGKGFMVFLASGKVDKSYRVYVTPAQLSKIQIGKQVNVRPYCKKGTSVQTSVKLTLAPGINKWQKPLF